MNRFRWIDDGGHEHLLDDVEHLAHAIDTGVITGDTLVHDARLDRWLKASKHDVLRALQHGSPSGRLTSSSAPSIRTPAAMDRYASQLVTTTSVATPSSSTRASIHPWRRWFARLTDCYLAALALGFMTVFIPSLTALWDNVVLANMATVAFFVPVEAWLLSTFGTTVGKALLGIRLTVGGARLSFGQALNRAWNVYIRGMGLGMPLITLFTMAHQHGKLTKESAATYDRDSVVSVSHSPVTPLRVVILIILWLAFLGLIVYDSAP